MLVETLAARDRRPRKVVGVYLGWRGASVPLPLVENLTFWTRKNAAERVGGRSAKQLLMDLNQFRSVMNGWDGDGQLAPPDKTQLMLIGHSFGGLVMYQALHTELMERARRVRCRPDGACGWDVARSFGDFVLLVNPAFEGAAYEPLWVAARERCYPPGERPVMAIVTSEGDWATGMAFPAGRAYTLAQSAPQPGERETVWKAIGHLDRYRTHHLAPGPAARPVGGAGLSQPTRSGTEQAIAQLQAQPRPLLAPETDRKAYDGAVLERVGGGGPDYLPYLVVSADPAIIKDHSDIWNDRFVDFMRSFVAAEVMGRPGQLGEAGCRPFDYPPAMGRRAGP